MASKDAPAVILSLARIDKIGPVLTRLIINSASDPIEIPNWSLHRFSQIPGISPKLASHIKDNLDLDYGLKIVEWADRAGYQIITLADSNYPTLLRDVYDAPSYLFIKGSIPESDKRAIGIVGARHATDYGRSMAARIASELARNEVTVVSGMAMGIDSAAHRGALAAGGRTIAVLGSGIDVIYPSSNRKLYSEIAENGAVVSEFLPGTRPSPHNFPRRNRIISGLSRGVAVIEAGQKSGALLTADLAVSQGRKLFAMPGNIVSEMSQGTNELIKTGAILMTSPADIFSVLPELKKDYITPSKLNVTDLTEGESLVYQFITDQPVQIDDLVRKCQAPVSDIVTYLLSLELRGLVKQLSGKRFIAA